MVLEVTLESSKSPIIWIALRKNSVFKIKEKVIIWAKLDCAVVLLNSYGLLLGTILRALLGPSYWEWSVAAMSHQQSSKPCACGWEVLNTSTVHSSPSPTFTPSITVHLCFFSTSLISLCVTSLFCTSFLVFCTVKRNY